MIVSNETTPKEHHVLWKTHGTCSQFIDIDLDNEGWVKSVHIIGGCPGNTTGICYLVKGMKAAEVKKSLKGINCGNKGTSCPDQLAQALEAMGI